MKKVAISPLQEILSSHIITNQDYIEEALGVFTNNLMQISSGVISGLAVSSGSLTTISVATGYLYQNSVYGTLESASGVTISTPVSGTRTDLIVGYYSQVYDSPSSGYVLLDVSAGTETIQDNPSRYFGAIIIEQLTNTSYATRPSNKVPLCELTLNSSGITGISDVRLYAAIQRFQSDLQTWYNGIFFAGF